MQKTAFKNCETHIIEDNRKNSKTENDVNTELCLKIIKEHRFTKFLQVFFEADGFTKLAL